MRKLTSLLIGLVAAVVFVGGADAQMGPRAFGGGFRRGHFVRAAPFWRPMPYPYRPRFVAPPLSGPRPPVANPAWSTGPAWRTQQEMARQGVRGGQLAPLDRVIASIGRRTPGRQLDTGIEYRGERPVYRVRWITAHGRRVDYMVDAATGAILGER